MSWENYNKGEFVPSNLLKHYKWVLFVALGTRNQIHKNGADGNSSGEKIRIIIHPKNKFSRSIDCKASQSRAEKTKKAAIHFQYAHTKCTHKKKRECKETAVLGLPEWERLRVQTKNSFPAAETLKQFRENQLPKEAVDLVGKPRTPLVRGVIK